MVTISVVIPTYNRPEALAECLAALSGQTYAQSDFEVVVCDDGSEPGAAQKVRQICSQVRLVTSPRLGPAGARNQAAAVARGQFLVFLDDDCLPEPDWLARLSQALQAGTLVSGQTVNGYPGNLPSEIGELILEVGLETFTPGPGSLYFFRSTNLGVAKLDFEALGGWNVDFRTAEDREFCHRWQLGGGRMRRVREALVHHKSYLGLGHFARRHFAYGRGAFHFHRRRGAAGGGDWSFLRYYHRVWSAICDRPGNRLAGCLLFSLWQLMNLCGFVWELGRYKLAARRPDNARRCSPPAPPIDADATAEHSAANLA